MSFIWEIDVDFWSGPEGTDEKDAVLDTISSARSLLLLLLLLLFFALDSRARGSLSAEPRSDLGDYFEALL